jgi:hypothetical protein
VNARKLHAIVFLSVMTKYFCVEWLKKQFKCVDDFEISLCGTVKCAPRAAMAMLHCEK